MTLPRALHYESTASSDIPAGPRPWWVYALVGVYALLVAGLLALATWMPMEDQDSLVQVMAGAIVVMLLCGASLVVIPVRAARRRPVSRRSLRLPILASGL